MEKHLVWSRGENFRPKKPRGVQRTPPAAGLRIIDVINYVVKNEFRDTASLRLFDYV